MRVVSHDGKLSPYADEPCRVGRFVLPLAGRRIEGLGHEELPVARLDDPTDPTEGTPSDYLVVIGRTLPESLGLAWSRRLRGAVQTQPIDSLSCVLALSLVSLLFLTSARRFSMCLGFAAVWLGNSILIPSRCE